MDNHTSVRRCITCGEEFPRTAEYFHRDKQTKDGLDPRCKRCRSVQAQRYRARTADKRRETTRRYRESHREELRRKGRIYVASHRKQATENMRRWRLANLEHARALGRKNDAKRKDKKRTADRHRHKANRQHYNAYSRKFFAERPGLGAIYYHRRRARKAELPSTLTKDEWKHALAYFGGCCAVCGRPPGLWHRLSIDHWIPLTAEHCPGTVATNVVPLCHGKDGCNSRKHDSDPEEWLIREFGKHKAAKISAKIQAYFASLKK